MKKGNIGVTTENIFPIIKKFLYSDHEIFIRELVSNAVDATQKIKTLFSVGEFKGELGDLKIRIFIDKKKKTITVSDRGIGMTTEEVDKYINQVAFSSAEEFLEKYKSQSGVIIGHFGLGFYSSFIVAEKVEMITRSYKNEKAMHWICEGNPEYSLEETEKSERGTDVILHLGKEFPEYLEETKIEEILKKYCKFLPVEICFGKEKEWKDGKYEETEKDKIINNTKPAWTQKPADLKEDDYKNFYRELYPSSFEEPLFNIHLNVDYPFHLTGILYFPKIKSNFEIQKNKIQLYCNQVYVTDSVEGIVPEFLTLLHGVIDSPDIPLNISRSYLQGDPNVKKISGHITKKVADRLEEIFKKDRSEFEKKWDDMKLFIEFGMISEEKFYEKASKFTLLKNTEGKYFTLEEYKTIITENQTDKDKTLIYLYTTNKEEQYSFTEEARSRGYDVLLMDGQLDTHFINFLEQKLEKSRFVRVDSDVSDKIIRKEKDAAPTISQEEQEDLRPVFNSRVAGKDTFFVTFEAIGEKDQPITITQSEYMRRMKDMSKMGGQGMNFYGEMPGQYNLVVNTSHPLVSKVISDTKKKTGESITALNGKIKPIEKEQEDLRKEQDKKKADEITQEEKDKLENIEKEVQKLKEEKEKILSEYSKENPLIKQMIDLALLANNMLKGEELSRFIKRSIEMIK